MIAKKSKGVRKKNAQGKGRMERYNGNLFTQKKVWCARKTFIIEEKLLGRGMVGNV